MKSKPVWIQNATQLITLKSDDMSYDIYGTDFELNKNVDYFVKDVFEYCNSTNLLDKIFGGKKQKDFYMTYDNVCDNFEDKLIEIADELNCEPKDSEMVFDATKEDCLVFSEEQYGKIVNMEQLKQQINESLNCENNVVIDFL